MARVVTAMPDAFSMEETMPARKSSMWGSAM